MLEGLKRPLSERGDGCVSFLWASNEALELALVISQFLVAFSSTKLKNSLGTFFLFIVIKSYFSRRFFSKCVS